MPISSSIVRGGSWALCLQERLAQAPDNIDAWLDGELEQLKEESHSRVGLISLQNERCYLKFYRHKSALQSLSFKLGYGRAVHSFDRAQELLAAHVSVPEPRACLRINGGMLLLTEALLDSTDLIALWRARPSDEKLRRIMTAAGLALAGLHSAGYSHGDCKWSNLMRGDGTIFFIDLEGVRRSQHGNSNLTRDLARFTVNAEDMALPPPHYEVFLSAYAEGVGRERDSLIREILVPLQQLRRKHLAKYGPRGHQLI